MGMKKRKQKGNTGFFRKMTGWIQKKAEGLGNGQSMLLLFLLCFLPRAISSLFMDYTMYIADETSTISGVTLLTDMDWSNVISQVGYYGVGFTVLFTPLYSLFDDPFVIYHIMLLVMCLLQSLPVLIAYRIMRYHLKETNNLVCLIAAVSANYMVTRRPNNVTNEHPLILLSWLIVWLLFILVDTLDDYKKKVFFSALLALAMGYAMTIHERGILYVVALIIMVALFLWVYRRLLISPVTFGIIYGACYYGANLLKIKVLENNWSNLTNAVSNTSVSFDYLTNWLKALPTARGMASILGPVTTISMVTGGLFLLSFCIAIVFLWKGIFGRKQLIGVTGAESGSGSAGEAGSEVGGAGKTSRKDKAPRKEWMFEGMPVYDKQRLFLLFLFLFACISMSILSQSMSWTPNLNAAYILGTGRNRYGLKILTYIRYFGIYVGPLVLITMYSIWKYGEQCRRLMIYVLFGAFFLARFWMVEIQPYIAKSSNALEAFLPFSLESRDNLQFRMLFYTGGIFVLLLFAVLCYYCLRRKKQLTLLVALLLLILYQFFYNVKTFDSPKSEQAEVAVNTYNALQDTGIVDKVEDIYVYQSGSNRQWLNYQQLYYDKTVKVGLPELYLSEGIIISDSDYQQALLVENGWKVIDNRNRNCDNVWIKGENLESLVESKGLQLIEFMPRFIYLDKTRLEDRNTIFGIVQGVYEVNFPQEEIFPDRFRLQLWTTSGGIVTEKDIDREELESNGYKTRIAVREDIDSVHLILTDAAGVQIAPSELTMVRVSSDYVPGMDNQLASEEIRDAILEMQWTEPVVMMNNALEEADLQIWQSLLPGTVLLQKNLSELTDDLDTKMIISAARDDWMSLLDRYALLRENQAYVLLMDRRLLDSYAVKALDNDGFIPDVLMENQYEPSCMPVDEEGQLINPRMPLLSGDYELVIEGWTDNQLSETPQVSVALATATWGQLYPAYVEDGKVKCSFSLDHTRTMWKAVLYCNNYEASYLSLSLRKKTSANEYYCYTYLNPCIEGLNRIGWNGDVVLYNEEDISTTQGLLQWHMQSGLSGKNRVSVESYGNFYPDRIDADCFIIPTAIQNQDILYMFLEDYAIIAKSDKYAVFLKASETVRERLGQEGMLPYAQDNKVSGDFYKKQDGSQEAIDLPHGAYEMKIVLNLAPDSVAGTEKLMDLYANGVLFMTVPVAISQEDVLQGYTRIDLSFQTLQPMRTLYAMEQGAETVNARIEQIFRKENTYRFDLSTFVSKNVLYNSATGTMQYNGKGRIKIESQPYPVQTGYAYTYYITYRADSPRVTAKSYNGEYQSINSKTMNVYELGDGLYQSILLVKPSENRSMDKVLLEVSGCESFELISIEAEKEMILN